MTLLSHNIKPKLLLEQTINADYNQLLAMMENNMKSQFINNYHAMEVE